MTKKIKLKKSIGIVGTRRRDTTEVLNLIDNTFKNLYNINDTVVSGGCKWGADRFAPTIAKKYGLTLIVYYPKWDLYKKGAGFKRNTKIAKKANVLIAVVADDRTGGTEDTIRKFLIRADKTEEQAVKDGDLWLL